MYSQASVSHSVHNQPHGYWVTAHPGYGAVSTHPTGANIIKFNDLKITGYVFFIYLYLHNSRLQEPINGDLYN